MSLRALIGELQWTAVFAAQMVGTAPEGLQRGSGIALAALWLLAAALRPTHATMARVLRSLVWSLLALLALLMLAAYGSADVAADPALASQLRRTILDSLLLLLQGVGLAAFAAFFWSRSPSGRTPA